MTKLVGVIGHPLGHTISPAFQQAALDCLGLDVRYEAWDIPPAHLSDLLRRLRGLGYLGASVTIPYKEVALGLVDELDEMAGSIGAVNTLVNRGGRLQGYNTDAPGFLQALREEAGFDPRGKRAVLLGAGGAARAVAFALAGAGIRSLAVVNRTPERAQALVQDLGHRCPEADLSALPWGDGAMREALARCHLLVNCTPVGQRHSPTEGATPVEAGLIPAGILVYDLVYNPPETPLIRAAALRGARALGGLSMLVYQGVAAFQMWTGQEAPVEVMMRAAKKALEA